jgi:hypothetical protein
VTETIDNKAEKIIKSSPLEYMDEKELVETIRTSKDPLDLIFFLLESNGNGNSRNDNKFYSEPPSATIKSLLLQELQKAINDKRLMPITNLDIAPDTQRNLFVVLTPNGEGKPYIQVNSMFVIQKGKLKKYDLKLSIKLLEFDALAQKQSAPQFEGMEIPIRELLVRSSVCRSVMELGQKHINFGLVEKHKKRSKTILIRNNSEVTLYYNIKKSGSISSGDIFLGEDKNGAIRGFSKKEVVFIFEPTLAGVFNEKLIVENVLDNSFNQVLTIKANVKKETPFFIEKLEMDFGVCLINEKASHIQQIVISNSSAKQPRLMEVKYHPDELAELGIGAHVEFEMLEEDDSNNSKSTKPRRKITILSKETEEQIEVLEQKLKIARRKGRKDKMKKISDKIERLKSGFLGEDYESEQYHGAHRPSNSLVDTKAETFRTKQTDTGIIFSIQPRSIRTVLSSFRAISDRVDFLVSINFIYF